MAKKQHFLIIDTETTINDHVADFGAVICDRKGLIIKELGVMVADFRSETLFHDKNANDIWGNAGLLKRTANYTTMLESGQRMLASVGAINRWLEKVNALYQPELTAYNLAFDLSKMQNSGIDVSIFDKRFCLWQAASGLYGNTKKYRQFILDNHLFNSPTQLGNMTYQTNAEVMASFINGEMLPPEPHTALEDAKFYELPILVDILKKAKWREKVKAYSWRDYQVKNAFTAI
jgi:hypothetical protein